MERRFRFETPLGEVWFWGRDTGKPLVVFATGAFAEHWVFDKFQSVLEDFDVLRFHLPGNHSPPLATTSIGTISAALSFALREKFNRPTVLVGLSVGALVALAVRAPEVLRLVLVEPFLRTAHEKAFQAMIARAEKPTDFELLWNVLGVSEDAVEDRNYSHLIADVRCPGRVLLGDLNAKVPLPSLVDRTDREALGRQPRLVVSSVPGAGHNVPAYDIEAFYHAIRAACDEVLAANTHEH